MLPRCPLVSGPTGVGCGALGVQSHRCVGGEDGDSITGLELVDGLLESIRVDRVVVREGIKRGVQVVVDLLNVLIEMLPWLTLARGSLDVGKQGMEDVGQLYSRMAGNFFPLTPAMPNLPTLPLLRRSNMDRPTTPTFLSEPEAPPPTKPVVYSPVPIWRESQGISVVALGLGKLTIKTLRGSIVSAVKVLMWLT